MSSRSRKYKRQKPGNSPAFAVVILVIICLAVIAYATVIDK
jgi:hypothetical protein